MYIKKSYLQSNTNPQMPMNRRTAHRMLYLHTGILGYNEKQTGHSYIDQQ